MFDEENLSVENGLGSTQPDSFDSMHEVEETDFGSMTFASDSEVETPNAEDIWGSSFNNQTHSEVNQLESEDSMFEEQSADSLREEIKRKHIEKMRQRRMEQQQVEASSDNFESNKSDESSAEDQRAEMIRRHKEKMRQRRMEQTAQKFDDLQEDSFTTSSNEMFVDTSSSESSSEPSVDFSSTSNNTGVSWGETSGVSLDMPDSDTDSNYIIPSSDDSESGFISDIRETSYKKDVNLSKKTVSFIVAGAFVLLALLLIGLDKWTNRPASSKPKPTSSPSVVTSAPSKDDNLSGDISKPNTEQSNAPASVLVPIPDNMSLNYSGNLYDATGVVVAREKFVQGKQVLYCITIRVAVGSSSMDVKYYCNYASYSAVRKGDLLQITYQQVDDSYISVNEIRK